MGSPEVVTETLAVVPDSRSINTDFVTCLREAGLIKNERRHLLPAWVFCTTHKTRLCTTLRHAAPYTFFTWSAFLRHLWFSLWDLEAVFQDSDQAFTCLIPKHPPPPPWKNKSTFVPVHPILFGQNLEMAVKGGYNDYLGKRQPWLDSQRREVYS